ncbi:MAG: CoA pyrophosphatase [Lachnospiraceae bacterium]|nr:CoA pyrophosphatase [Lachnospiraceae bacterium]
MTDELSRIRKRFRDHQTERIETGRSSDAAVLIPLVETEEGLSILFEVRRADIPQGGEICFPGGHIETGETAEETAVRETSEELAIGKERVEVICPMHLRIGHWGGDVTSFLGILKEYDGSYSEKEVERVFTIPLSYFRTHPPRIHKAQMVFQAGEDFPYHLIPGGREYPFDPIERRMSFYETEYGVIWGLTASFLTEFLGEL